MPITKLSFVTTTSTRVGAFIAIIRKCLSFVELFTLSRVGGTPVKIWLFPPLICSYKSLTVNIPFDKSAINCVVFGEANVAILEITFTKLVLSSFSNDASS